MNQLVWIAGIVLGLAFPAYGAETRAKAESRTEAESLMQDFASSAKLSGRSSASPFRDGVPRDRACGSTARC